MSQLAQTPLMKQVRQKQITGLHSPNSSAVNLLDGPVKPKHTHITIGGENVSLLSDKIGAFATELAARLEPMDKVLNRYRVSREQLRDFLKNNTFRNMIKEASIAFGSYKNIGARIKLKAQILTEMGLDDMYTIFNDPNETASARVQAWSQVKTLTGLEKPVESAPAEKFNLVINIPSQARADGAEMMAAQRLTIDGEYPEQAQDNNQEEENKDSFAVDTIDGRVNPFQPREDGGEMARVSEPYGRWKEERSKLGVATPIKIV